MYCRVLEVAVYVGRDRVLWGIGGDSLCGVLEGVVCL